MGGVVGGWGCGGGVMGGVWWGGGWRGWRKGRRGKGIREELAIIRPPRRNLRICPCLCCIALCLRLNCEGSHLCVYYLETGNPLTVTFFAKDYPMHSLSRALDHLGTKFQRLSHYFWIPIQQRYIAYCPEIGNSR